MATAQPDYYEDAQFMRGPEDLGGWQWRLPGHKDISTVPIKAGYKEPAKKGRGAYGLPDAFATWSPGARYSIPGVADYIKNVQPIKQHFSDELGKDYRGILAEQGRKTIDRELGSYRKTSSERATRGGYGGGTVSSPLMSMELQMEEGARAGAYGLAAQQATMFAQQMKRDAATGLQNIEANILNSYLVPGQMQAANTAKVPVSGGGPATWAQAAQIAAAAGAIFQ